MPQGRFDDWVTGALNGGQRDFTRALLVARGTDNSLGVYIGCLQD